MAAWPSRTARDALAEALPESLRPLARLAFNYWWSWQPEGDDLWRLVDPEHWDACGGNPVRLLREASRDALERAAANRDLRDGMVRLLRGLDAALASPGGEASLAAPAAPVAFLCAEYGVHASLPVYSGGLGVLAGDLLKEASDRRVPLVAVGLLYRRGYFHQRLDPSGWQHEYWTLTGDAEALYNLLEREVVPLFYERDEHGVPRGWVQRIRASLRSLGPVFNTARVLNDYLAQIYRLAPR